MKLLCARLVSLAVLTLPLAAAATTTLTSTGTPFIFTITDLDANDGVAAGISDVRYWRDYRVSAYPALPNSPGYYWNETRSLVPVNTTAQTAWASTQAGTAGPFGAYRQEVKTTDAFQQSTEANMAWASVYDQTGFTMAPHTRLTFTGTITVSIDMQFDTEALAGDYYTRVTYGAGLGYGGNLTYSERFTTPGSHTKEISITGIMDNDTDGYAYYAGISLLSNLNADVNWPTVPVPEPDTYAMLLAGLCIAGAAARKRKA